MAPDSQKAAGEAAFCVRPCREGGCFSKAQGTAASAGRSHLKPFSNPPATGTQSPEQAGGDALQSRQVGEAAWTDQRRDAFTSGPGFLEAVVTVVTLPPGMCAKGGVRRASLLIALLIVFLGAAAFTPTSRAAAAGRPDCSSGLAQGGEIGGPAFADSITSGMCTEWLGTTITSQVTFLNEVRFPLRCLFCIFRGSIGGRDVTFDHTVELSGSVVEGSLNFVGTHFEGGLFLRPALKPPTTQAVDVQVTDRLRFDEATFDGDVDLSGALVGDLAIFDHADFRSDASFSTATFLGDVHFYATRFDGDVSFFGIPSSRPAPGIVPCQATSGIFWKQAVFIDASFKGSADFRGRCFDQDLQFDRVRLTGSLDMSGGTVRGAFDLTGAQLGRQSSFQRVRVSGSSWFDGVSAGGPVDLGSASFGRHVSMIGFSSAGGLNLTGTHLVSFSPCGVAAPGVQIGLVEFKTDGRHLFCGPDDRVGFMTLVETQARAVGDLRLANEARYELLVQATHKDHGVAVVWDFIYRWFFGFLVKPLRPLMSLVFVLLLGVIARFSFRRSGAASRRGFRWPGGVSGEPSAQRESRWRTLDGAIDDTWRGAARLRGDRSSSARPAGLAAKWAGRLERTLALLLMTVFVMCVANYNATLHDFIQSFHP